MKYFRSQLEHQEVQRERKDDRKRVLLEIRQVDDLQVENLQLGLQIRIGNYLCVVQDSHNFHLQTMTEKVKYKSSFTLGF